MDADLADFIARRFVRSVELSPTRATSHEISSDLARRLAEAWGWKVDPDDAPSEFSALLSDNGFVAINAGNDKLSVAGALFLVSEPGAALGGKAFVEVFRYRDESVNYDQRAEFRGPLHDQVDRATDFVLDELGFDLAFLGVTRHELHRLPRLVLREAVANAVAHRSYTTLGEAVRLEIRPDRVVVRSPGGLPDGVTLDNLAQRSVPRNALVIRTLRFLGVAEDAGRGVDVMQRHMALNMMRPPRFEADDTSVTVSLRLGSQAAPVERAWLAQTLAADQQMVTRPYSVGDRELMMQGLQPEDLALLVHASRGAMLSNSLARSLIGADAPAAAGALRRLRDRGLLEQDGVGAGTTYGLSAEIKDPDGVSRQPRDFSAEILEMAREGPLTNTSARAATGLSRVAVVRIFNELVASGRLERRGSRRGTHYVVHEGGSEPTDSGS